MGKSNRGSRGLARVIARKKLSQGDVRRAVSAPAGLVSRWLSGERKPGVMFASRLRAIYGIPIEDWFEEDDEDAPRAA
jgi:transcriptional regulator with XRE-family HTH domain